MAAKIISGLVEKRSLDRAAADVIRQAITSGALAPGKRLTETELSTELNLSRSTIRAALQRLMSEGLVKQKPYLGWEVASLSSKDAWELCTLRSSLESLAAQLAAANPNRRQPIEAAFEDLKAAAKSRNQKRITDSDLALHKAIVVLSGHKRLADHYGLVEQQVRMYMASSNAILERPEMVISNHRKMISALLRGDAAASERYAREHNKTSGELLVRHIQEKEAKQTKKAASRKL
ncbi:DNA-binding GntR family transcriptional regulator [Bradyrhizobium sp. CIR48]|uniref:GntR family transcriptional regulator n=1 Tax=Bradyrhizobium sp. CIR48 TaxID=2663840 RepID=UPI0016069EF2|nr:GntR family transcriptional regulator [Bradyrhizobium sp. CIR48]MBB4428345.1 DNA-binding GntR family transcriptional regulator [Bradyrhizobium sp. CIR48]